GSGIASALADAGVRVAVSGRSPAALEEVTGRLASQAGAAPAIIVGDVCAKGGPAQIAAEAIAALGGHVDILVNNGADEGSLDLRLPHQSALHAGAEPLGSRGPRRLREGVQPRQSRQAQGERALPEI